MTTFESVEALWEDPWKSWKPKPGKDGQGTGGKEGKDKAENPYGTTQTSLSSSKSSEDEIDVDVNETMLTSQEMNQLVELEEADWEKFFDHREPADEYALEEEDPFGPDDDPSSNSPHGSQCVPGNSYQASTEYVIKISISIQSRQIMFSPSDSTLITPTKSSRKRLNPFQEAWLKLAGGYTTYS